MCSALAGAKITAMRKKWGIVQVHKLRKVGIVIETIRYREGSLAGGRGINPGAHI